MRPWLRYLTAPVRKPLALFGLELARIPARRPWAWPNDKDRLLYQIARDAENYIALVVWDVHDRPTTQQLRLERRLRQNLARLQLEYPDPSYEAPADALLIGERTRPGDPGHGL